MVNGGDVELAQAAVLGAALIDESLVGELTLKVEDRDFATPKCRMVYQALKKLFLAGQPTDPVTVVNQLSGGGEDGWRQYVMWAMDVASTAVNVWEHVRIMRGQAGCVASRSWAAVCRRQGALRPHRDISQRHPRSW